MVLSVISMKANLKTRSAKHTLTVSLFATKMPSALQGSTLWPGMAGNVFGMNRLSETKPSADHSGARLLMQSTITAVPVHQHRFYGQYEPTHNII